jgi:hypothetical protein
MDVNAGLSKLALETSGSVPKSKDRLVAEMFDGKDEEITVGGAGLNFEALVPLKAGLLVNQQYAVSPKQLNKIIFEQGRMCSIGSNLTSEIVFWGPVFVNTSLADVACTTK